MWRIKTTKDGVWLGRWILHSATQFHPFSTLPWDDQYPLHHRAIDQSLREGKNSGALSALSCAQKEWHHQAARAACCTAEFWWRLTRRFGLQWEPEQLSADAGYCSEANLEALEIRAKSMAMWQPAGRGTRLLVASR